MQRLGQLAIAKVHCWSSMNRSNRRQTVCCARYTARFWQSNSRPEATLMNSALNKSRFQYRLFLVAVLSIAASCASSRFQCFQDASVCDFIRFAAGSDVSVCDSLPSNFVTARYALTNTSAPDSVAPGALVFSSRGIQDHQEIRLLDLSTGKATNLTPVSSDNGYPSWSPDGRKLAFVSNRDGHWQIYSMDRDGTSQRNLSNNSFDDGYIDWSPDGTCIVFASTRDGNREIYLMSADGLHQRRLTNNLAEDVHPVFSPDGKRIAFASERSDIPGRTSNRQIYLMNTDGSHVVQLTFTTGYNDYPAWAPDGSQIAIASDRDSHASNRLQLYSMKPDGTSIMRLTSGDADNRHPAWSADGKLLFFSSNRDGAPRIYVMRRDGGQLKGLTFAPGGTVHEHPQVNGSTGLLELTLPAPGPYFTISVLYDAKARSFDFSGSGTVLLWGPQSSPPMNLGSACFELLDSTNSTLHASCFNPPPVVDHEGTVGDIVLSNRVQLLAQLPLDKAATTIRFRQGNTALWQKQVRDIMVLDVSVLKPWLTIQ